MSRPAVEPTTRGTIVALLHGWQVRVRLEDGTEVAAVFRKGIIRLAFVIRVGEEVDVAPRTPPTMARVVRLWRAGRPIE